MKHQFGAYGARTAAANLFEAGLPSIRNKAYVAPLVESHGALLEATLNPKYHNYENLLASSAMLMENTVRHWGAQEAAKNPGTMSAMLTESGSATTTQNLDAYKQTIYPLLMSVFPNLIANEIVSVQPTAGPQALIYYLSAEHSKAKGSTAAGTDIHKDYDYSYSSELVKNEALQVGNGTDFGGAGAVLNGALVYTPVLPRREQTGSPIIEVLVEEVSGSGNVVQSARDDGAGGFVFTPAGGSTSGAIGYATGQISNFKFQNAPALGNLIRVSYRYDMEGNQNRPTISLNTRSTMVETEEYSLKAEWSIEAMQDLIAQQGISAEAEFMALIADKLQLDIDRTIINDIHQQAQFSTVWNRAAIPSGVAELDYLRTLITVITQQGAQIHQASGRAPANFGIVAPVVSGILHQLNTHGDFIPAAPVEERPTSYGPRNSDFGIFKVGSLGYRLSVYQDPGWTPNQILLGLRGSDYLDAGYVWAPYVALYMTQTLQDPTDGKHKKLFMSRSARKMLRPEYYSKISILNL